MTSFKDALGDFRLPSATDENIGDWLNVIDGWVGGAAGTLMTVRSCALQELLICEDEVANWLSSRTAPLAPAPASIPAEYPRLMPDESRPRQTKLRWWDRFQTADGWLAATARLLVALAVVGTVVVFGAALAFRTTEPSEEFTPGGLQYYPSVEEEQPPPQ
jgi:hypothetical protein